MTEEDMNAWAKLLRDTYGIAWPIAPEETSDDTTD
jgi:hypothetical protein